MEPRADESDFTFIPFLNFLPSNTPRTPWLPLIQIESPPLASVPMSWIYRQGCFARTVFGFAARTNPYRCWPRLPKSRESWSRGRSYGVACGRRIRLSTSISRRCHGVATGLSRKWSGYRHQAWCRPRLIIPKTRRVGR